MFSNDFERLQKFKLIFKYALISMIVLFLISVSVILGMTLTKRDVNSVDDQTTTEVEGEHPDRNKNKKIDVGIIAIRKNVDMSKWCLQLCQEDPSKGGLECKCDSPPMTISNLTETTS